MASAKAPARGMIARPGSKKGTDSRAVLVNITRIPNRRKNR